MRRRCSVRHIFLRGQVFWHTLRLQNEMPAGVSAHCRTNLPPDKCQHPVDNFRRISIYRDLSSLPAGRWLWISTLAWLLRHQFAVRKVSAPRTTRFLGFGGDAEMGNVADTRQSLATETIRPDRRQVLKGLQFGCRETLAQNGKILPLENSVSAFQST